jgi:2,3-bisphosphoglycerate-independent phosphoglycerate mutase
MITKKETKLLLILDGWGHSTTVENNAIALAKTPVWDKIQKECSSTLICTSGVRVGLPDEQMGNSEVGHMNIGAGRIVKQDFTRIHNDIESGDFYRNPVLRNAFDYATYNNKSIHIMGMLSDGGIHSHIDHISALLDMVKKVGSLRVYFHIFTDGRDCPPKSAKKYIEAFENKIKEAGVGEIVSVIGRYYAMDRDHRWRRTRDAYELISRGVGKFLAKSATQAVDMAYERGETDEFIQSTVINAPVPILKGDVVIFMNYRSDRARQLTRAFNEENFEGFSRGNFLPIQFFCLTEYKKDFNLPVIFPSPKLNNVLGKYVSNIGMTQLRIAETEKYAHVTFFFNGGVEDAFYGEDRILIPSPNVHTYDLKPEMSAFELTDSLVTQIESQKYDLIICNFANTDMVGHTGKLDAAISAVEAVDKCLGLIVEQAKETGCEILITADHGNIEQMFELDSKEPHTAHTTNPVPLIYIGPRSAKFVDPQSGALSDIAPTLLYMMDVEQPPEMSGHSLLTFN